MDDGCVSLNFWFRDQATSRSLALPLAEAQHLAMRRNIEKFCSATLGPREAHRLLPQLPHEPPPSELAALRAGLACLLGAIHDCERAARAAVC